MKLTKSQLKEFVKKEIESILRENNSNVNEQYGHSAYEEYDPVPQLNMSFKKLGIEAIIDRHGIGRCPMGWQEYGAGTGLPFCAGEGSVDPNVAQVLGASGYLSHADAAYKLISNPSLMNRI
jgi:hypothetical protein